MSKTTRKNWTRNLALARLEQINDALDDLEKLAEGGGKIPMRFRKRLASAVKNNKDIIEMFQKWTM